MKPNVLRAAGGAVLIWWALGMPGLPGPGAPSIGPYTGPMAGVAEKASSMASEDSAALSAAFSAAADMLDADSLNLISNTEAAQRFAFGVLTFGYNGLGQPAKKYPGLADAIEAELVKVYGTDVAPVDAAKKSQISAAFREISKAVR